MFESATPAITRRPTGGRAGARLVAAALGLGSTPRLPGRRGEVASSYFVVLHVALSIPIVGVGLATQDVGLRPAALIFTAFVAALAAACLISLLTRRPAKRPA